MYPHRIRLRGPWECEPVSQLGESSDTPQALPLPLRVTMPCRLRDGGLAGFAGTVRLRRHFGYPGRIDADERVWLTCANLSDSAVFTLNEKMLGGCSHEDCPCEWDITSLLRSRNELQVLLTALSDAGGLWGEVALEVRRTAFLRNVLARLERDADFSRLIVTGEAVGISERPLDLYAVLDGRTVADTTVRPSEVGARFELHAEAERSSSDSPTQHLRLELVDGGVIWYCVEREVW